MLTKEMQRYLIETGKPKKPLSIKHCVYMNRIQKRITRELDMFLWLAVNYPEVFLLKGHVNEYGNENKKWKKIRKDRLKKLILAISALNKNIEAQLVRA